MNRDPNLGLKPEAIKSAVPMALKNADLKILTNVKSPWLALMLRAIFRSQRPRAGIFRSPYADLKIGARKGRDLKISTSRVSNNLWNAK